ncbi:flavodoxin reductase [Gelidibacter salicanalis]|uniref:Flavodoxin reductase n=1 Tax=Gelidibacter salicanalis TaxID=291193 RepID=A0A5C7ALA5_9FLAO|nr:flavodoxin reductase [Gelidibacter salicanalis]TXE09157.1 flavodoxin reductase [Gelidibacter salicanalis]
MKNQVVQIKSIAFITHNVLHIITEKPEGMNFIPGQATELFIDEPGWENEGRPFTFTGLPDEEHLEFMIKTYPSHNGVTNKLRSLKAGDQVILNDVFGAISYKGEGTFIAGGAGVTPFISILRDLKSKDQLGNNTLIFANTSKRDIILKDEFQQMLGANFINILSEETVEGIAHGRITEQFLKDCGLSFDKQFYICGPPPMMAAVEEQLSHLDVKKEQLVMEEF